MTATCYAFFAVDPDAREYICRDCPLVDECECNGFLPLDGDPDLHSEQRICKKDGFRFVQVVGSDSVIQIPIPAGAAVL